MINLFQGRMTSKTRVLKAFHHEEPDRVPIDYSANSGIHNKLVQKLGVDPNNWNSLLEALGVDFRGVYLPYTGPNLHGQIEGRNIDPLWGIRTRWIEHESGGYWDFCDFPLEYADEDEVAAWPMPNPDHFAYDLVSEQCKHYKDYALYIGNPGLVDIINSTGMIRGMEQTLVDLATDEPAGLLYIDRKLDVQLKMTERVLEAAKGGIDFVYIGEDLGTQFAPMLSLELYRKHLRPRHQKFIDLAKAYNLPVMIHTCGSSSWAYNDFIEMGINVVDTLQPEAANMSPKYLKQTFGDRLAFHGCISTAGPLAYGSVEDIEKDVKETLDIMKPGGGFCLSPTHMIQDNSPVENVIEMYKTAHKYGAY